MSEEMLVLPLPGPIFTDDQDSDEDVEDDYSADSWP